MSPRIFALAVFAVAFLLRVALALLWPDGGGDSKIYLKVAENILSNGCVSLSDPASGACEPHWGGNQLPGYPAFVAAIWALDGHSNNAVLIVQSAANALAIAYLGLVLLGWLGETRRASWAIAIVVFSPIGLPWSRYLLTESLSVTLTIWVAAEIFRSVIERRLRAVMLGVAYAAAVFVRYDNAVLALPIACAAFSIHGLAAGLRVGLISALVAATPLGVWWGRGVAAGLPSLPLTQTLPDGARPPSGYIDWGHSWMVLEFEYPLWIYQVYNRCYSCIKLPAAAFGGAKEAAIVQGLMADLATHDGRPFPRDIDDAFGKLAAKRAAEDPVRHYLLLPAKRLGWLLFSPFNSLGWPVAVRGESLGADPDTADLISRILQDPHLFAVKAGVNGYRIMLLFAVLAMWRQWNRSRALLQRDLATAGLVYFVGTLALHLIFVLIEVRYLISAYAFLDTVAAVALARKSGRP